MKIKEKQIRLLYACNELVLVFYKEDYRAVQRLFEDIGAIDQSKDYDIVIAPKRRKRSLDANAYMWVLLGKLADRLDTSKEELYKKFIKEYGSYEILPIKNEAVPKFINCFEKNGVGWVCEILGPCKNFNDYTNVIAYYGSSTYDTKEMGRLLDQVLISCQENDIDTMTPNEIEKIKQLWGGENGS